MQYLSLVHSARKVPNTWPQGELHFSKATNKRPNSLIKKDQQHIIGPENIISASDS